MLRTLIATIFLLGLEETPGIDLSIVEHEIKMYPDVKPVRQTTSVGAPKENLCH